jgi:hypothetical protein
MSRRKIANSMVIRNMCRRCFAAQTVEELEVRAVELARAHAEEEVAAFEREGEVAQKAMVRVCVGGMTPGRVKRLERHK